MKKQEFETNRKNIQRKGFTVIELVMAMILTTFLLSGVLSAVTTTYRAEKVLSSNLKYSSNLRSLLYSVNFAIKNATVSFVVDETQFKGKIQGLTPGWSYLGVEKYDDQNRRVENFCNYIWQPDPNEPLIHDPASGKTVPNGKHVRQILASFPPDSGNGFDFGVRTESDSRVLTFRIEQGAVDKNGKLTNADIPAGKKAEQIPNRMMISSTFAYNSRNIGGLGRPGIGIAYRNDPIQFSTAQNPSGGRFVMMTDMSGSMRNYLDNSYPTRDAALKQCLSELIRKLAGEGTENSGNNGNNGNNGSNGNNSNDPKPPKKSPSAIEINISSFSDATKQIFTYNGMGLVKPTAENQYGEGPDPDADRRYFANPKENKDLLLQQVSKLHRGGATNHCDALRTSMAMLKKANDCRPLKNYLVLFTDGNPTTVNFSTEKMATIEDNTKRYWFNADSFKRTQSGPQNMLLLNRKYEDGGYKGMVIGGFPVDYDNYYPPFDFFTNQPRMDEDAGFSAVSASDLTTIRTYTYQQLLRNSNMWKLKNLVAAYNRGEFKNDEEYRQHLKDNYFGNFLGQSEGNYFQSAYYDDFNRNFKSPMELSLMFNTDNFFHQIGWSQGYFQTSAFPNMRAAWSRGYGYGSVLDYDLQPLMEGSFIETYKAMKRQGCEVDRIWVIGFGSARDVSKCKKMVENINSIDNDKAKYVFADSTDALMQTFENIVQVINEDLWFLDGPQAQE